ncbi:PDR/VanB family oxidoreductase [Paractinoplanes globisporus]|uniref:PDR/VanB family oxidoreductase n=1 Tax=Paractinoplanes globisporus TaxID=113565 RepID=A0ABW6WV18_9ACTN|nr:PDR/VanB family oxidoreductase [Actinoplanes globisporus]
MTDDRQLRVTQVTWEADGVLSLRLADPTGATLPAWTPGAHIDLRLPSGQLRQYSLCGDPGDRSSYRIAVLREEAGRGGSREVHETPLAGRILQVRGPRNHFELSAAPRYLFVAGGIGITPILAMARAASSPWTLWYGGRTATAMAFTDALPPGDVHLHPQDTSGLLPLADMVAATTPDTVVYACGPAPMLDALTQVCAAAGRRLRLERFAASATPVAASADDRPFEVELRQTGVILPVPAQRTLLDVILEAVPDVAYSCAEGYCGSCETKVLDGVPVHRDTVLTEDEQSRNDVMMICVGRSQTPRLVLDL